MLTYGNHLWSATASALNLGLRADDRWLACLPLFHVGGLAILLRSVIYGATAVLHPGFDPARVNAAIDDEAVTLVSVVANMLQRMLDDRGDRPYPASLRCVLLGGGPAPEPLLRRCAEAGVPVVQTYGLTETASQIVTLAPEDALRRLGSAGKPLFGAELRIVGEDGAECAAGKAGEIVVRGPSVTSGYLNRLDETAAAIRDGWLHTGDLGYLDGDGYLFVLDRRDDLIVSGGENVYPAEIEAVLQSHPDVLEAGVYGVEDERWVRAPVAVAVLREGATPDAESLLAYCRERLAAYKMPQRIEFTDSLPRNAAGKLLRNQLSGVSSHL
jgi:O-succinylbenzoic acid--CoA ligase